ncbi:MAG TPA: zinc-dependent metalloprotease [Actinophytocola sp.]|uniref:zinc-dependent metalloprotease n=1 Tax=Actinophytocola sp. TaxID=1872138 RepID=UPI002DDCCFD2|nr:zinc-dependent metalloprotease [Actinophytocola sp.]HEV2784645.1 zinc-dependent metalloprotease [Actinophytocola sp.]
MCAATSSSASGNGTGPGPSPVDWGLAVATAHRLMRPGPVIPRAEAEHTVTELRDVTTVAEGHVRALTGLGEGLPLHPGEVVDRHGWVVAAAEGLEALTEGALPVPSSRYFGGVLATSAGVQAGLVLAYLGGRVLGQYDPFGGAEQPGRLLLVAPNVVAAQQALDVPADDFRMWVCLHECTHRLQFTAVPWLRGYFAGEVGRFLSGLDETASSALNRLPEVIKAVRRRTTEGGEPGGLGLMEVLQSPEQRAVFDRLIALSTLLEGHADHVMDAVGPAVVPSVATIRQRFTARRRGGGLLDRILRALLGVDAKVRQYALGAAFTREVIDAVGMTGFNAVWTSPETLPLRSEISDAPAWLRRVHG